MNSANKAEKWRSAQFRIRDYSSTAAMFLVPPMLYINQDSVTVLLYRRRLSTQGLSDHLKFQLIDGKQKIFWSPRPPEWIVGPLLLPSLASIIIIFNCRGKNNSPASSRWEQSHQNKDISVPWSPCPVMLNSQQQELILQYLSGM